MPYLPLEDYGLIGDMRTSALIGKNGSVDWMCYPCFDSPSIFCALLDDAKGGRFQIAPEVEVSSTRQLYLPDSNVLVTAFMCEQGILEVIDFMPVPPEARITPDRPLGVGGPPPRLVRLVRALTGELPVKASCRPAFDYARQPHALEVRGRDAEFRTPELALRLRASVDLAAEEDAAVARFTLRQGEDVSFTLGAHDDPVPENLSALERDTLDFWRNWISQCQYTGRWREAVWRSALALKLLTFAPSGAIVAAPTTSLPEHVGGERNWDYRYMWPRDAAFTVYALLRLGFTAEAKAFNDFIEARSREGGSGIVRPIYRIDGGNSLDEQELPHLEGYRGSRPVRIGNGAHGQKQLDIYGELIDAIYLYNRHGEPLSYDEWCEVRAMLDWVCEHWREDDDGIWEVRSGQQPHLLSKVMCWVALERGIRIANYRGLPGQLDRWREERDTIYEEVMSRGFDPELGAFTQAYDTKLMDGANLLLPLVKFVGPRDPRWLSTLDRSLEKLAVGPLVYRYRLEDGADDGLEGEEGAFLACSFWMVECLVRAGRLEEARTKFEQLLAFSSPLGLMSEEFGQSGCLLGNMPQALSHLALISAAFHLDRALSGRSIG
ncbi:glycoside hydrolase family 15 protein [Deinococcus peraridilitoris]|uniref:Glycosyl hydrolase, glucoamylase n=1 Tax=Deinococcus peraridilitoris (strain DSM 19664 / LMG 22246 / CIP 109416 / KR-200) TaxID=937777 RepID=L0A582_DEIPD|nr:glycoside hydrolase family 15 protein [Deinococcus peraridilitoris]AFZ68155.1 glycosyl hydrolase, glucoamylase [Deinococcus peraridilitoris DSM 19664]